MRSVVARTVYERSAHPIYGAQGGIKFVEPRLFADPDVAARKLVEIASTIEPGQDGRIYIELVNAPFLEAGGNAAEYWAGMDRAIAKGWLMF
jgi:hypothetical protein